MILVRSTSIRQFNIWLPNAQHDTSIIVDTCRQWKKKVCVLSPAAFFWHVILHTLYSYHISHFRFRFNNYSGAGGGTVEQFYIGLGWPNCSNCVEHYWFMLILPRVILVPWLRGLLSPKSYVDVPAGPQKFDFLYTNFLPLPTLHHLRKAQ